MLPVHLSAFSSPSSSWSPRDSPSFCGPRVLPLILCYLFQSFLLAHLHSFVTSCQPIYKGHISGTQPFLLAQFHFLLTPCWPSEPFSPWDPTAATLEKDQNWINNWLKHLNGKTKYLHQETLQMSKFQMPISQCKKNHKQPRQYATSQIQGLL